MSFEEKKKQMVDEWMEMFPNLEKFRPQLMKARTEDELMETKAFFDGMCAMVVNMRG